MRVFKIIYTAAVGAAYCRAANADEAWRLLGENPIGEDTDRIRHDFWPCSTTQEIAESVYEAPRDELEEVEGDELKSILSAHFPSLNALTEAAEADKQRAIEEVLVAARAVIGRAGQGVRSDLSEALADLELATSAAELAVRGKS